MPKGLKFKEDKIETQIEFQDSERVLLERAAYDKAGVVYPADDFENQKEREFLYFKSLFPDTYYMWIDQVWRLLDERDGLEYIMYHAYHYCTQTIKTEGGKTVERNHSIDGYYGFYHRPIVKVKEFNPNGTIAKASIEKLEKVYTLNWSKKAFDDLIDSKDNKGTTTQFCLGIAPIDASMTVPLSSTTQMIRNREDFSKYEYDETMKLGRSQLSTTAPSMADIQRILSLRKSLADNPNGTDTSLNNMEQQISSAKTNKIMAKGRITDDNVG